MVKNMCFLLGGHRFKTRGGQNLYLARCDEVHEVGVPLECLQDVSALANSHVLASIGLQTVGTSFIQRLF